MLRTCFYWVVSELHVSSSVWPWAVAAMLNSHSAAPLSALKHCQDSFSAPAGGLAPAGAASMIRPNALWAVELIMPPPHYLLTNVCKTCTGGHKGCRHQFVQTQRNKPAAQHEAFSSPEVEVNCCHYLQPHISTTSIAALWENLLCSSIRESVWSFSERRSLLYLVRVRPVLVLGPVRGVWKGFVASFVLADVWLLAGVRAQVGF